MKFRTIFLIITFICVYRIFTEPVWIAELLIGLITFFIYGLMKALDDDNVMATEAEARGEWYPRMGAQIKIMGILWLIFGGAAQVIIVLGCAIAAIYVVYLK